MKILLAASEWSPLAQAGTLGEAMGNLSRALQAAGHDVSVVIPFYRSVREQPGRCDIRSTGVQFRVPIGSREAEAEVLECAGLGSQIFLVRRDEYFDRSGLYGHPDRPYDDNAERFIFFSKAVVELARRLQPAPDILHLHDWQTALVPVLVRQQRLPFRTVLTFHDVAAQGNFWGFDFGLTNLPGSFFSATGVEFFGRLNLLKGGVLFADAVTTISAHYARSIQRPEHGFGLDAVFRENAAKLSGILLGGADPAWQPATDPFLAKKYRAKTIATKKASRDALLAAVQLDPEPAGPVWALEAEPGGGALVLPLLDRLLAGDMRFVLVASAAGPTEREILVAQRRHAGRFARVTTADEPFAHRLLAGADAMLFTTIQEPSGARLVRALAYGTVPILFAQPGIEAIVEDYSPAGPSGTGFLCYAEGREAFWDTMKRAVKLHRQPAAWRALMRRGMATEFSWAATAGAYTRLYAGLPARPAV